MPPDDTRLSDDPVQTLRRQFRRVARLHQSAAWNESETLNMLSQHAVSAVAGEREWEGRAVSPESVAEVITSLPTDLDQALSAHLLNRDDTYWSEVRFRLPGTGTFAGRYTPEFLEGVKRLRRVLRRN